MHNIYLHGNKDHVRHWMFALDSGLKAPLSPQWPLPSTIGLNAILQSHLFLLDSKIDDMIKKFFEARKDRQATMSKYEGNRLPYPERLEKPEPATNWAFYSVPGCGKTRSIEILLSRNWGLFLIAGSLPVTEGNSKRSLSSNVNIYDPRREGYSRDLHYLWMTMNSYLQMFPDYSLRELRTRLGPASWTDILVYSSILVLGQFILIEPHAEPALWLEFQKCYDPFSPLFWLLTLQSNAFASRGRSITGRYLSSLLPERCGIVRQKMQEQNVTKFFIVLDEAQHDLDANFRLDKTLPPSSRWNHGKMIHLFHSMAFSLQSLLSQSESIEVTRIYSGTSLRLEELTAFLEDFGNYIVHSDFPLLGNKREFERLLGESMINAESVLDTHQLELIERYSCRLRGRYLWSTLYIDELKSLRSQGMTLDKNKIQKAANDVADRAKGDLKQRLQRLYTHGPPSRRTQKLLDHLCWIAVNCELFDRPKTIALHEYESLVDQGFAIVSKENNTKGSLQESLALEAALEWFRTNQPELLRRKMHELLQISALDHSNLGNAAEWFLAFVRSFSVTVLWALMMFPGTL